MIPSPPGPGDVPAIPERPDALRYTPPPAGALWDELDALQRLVSELTERMKRVEERLEKIEGERR